MCAEALLNKKRPFDCITLCKTFSLKTTKLLVSESFQNYHVLCLQGHEKEALNLMAAYLPKDNSPGSAFAEGGGLYALGKKNYSFEEVLIYKRFFSVRG